MGLYDDIILGVLLRFGKHGSFESFPEGGEESYKMKENIVDRSCMRIRRTSLIYLYVMVSIPGTELYLWNLVWVICSGVIGASSGRI